MLAPFAIGFTVFVCHLVAVPIDGCSINREPRRSSLLCDTTSSPPATSRRTEYGINF